MDKHKILWAGFSLLASIALWFFVNATQYTPVEQSIPGVKVVFAGEETLKEKGLIITDVESTEVTVRVQGPSGSLAKLNSSTLTATVNVSDFSEPSTISRLPVSVIFPSDVNTANIEYTSAPVSVAFRIDRLVTKTVPVSGEFVGSAADGYIIDGDLQFSPDSVVISGPERLLNTIECAFVTVDTVGLSESLAVESAYSLRNQSGDSIVSPDIEFESETITVRLPVVAAKTVPLSVDIIDGGGATASSVKITVSPASIQIAGNSSALDEIAKITVGKINLASFELTGEWTFPVAIPAGVRNVNGVESVQVTAEMIDMDVRDYTITDFTFTNKPAGCTVQIDGQTLTVRIRGKREVLDAPEPGSVTAEIDLSGVVPGSARTVAVKIHIADGVDIGAIGEYTTRVTLTSEE